MNGYSLAFNLLTSTIVSLVVNPLLGPITNYLAAAAAAADDDDE